MATTSAKRSASRQRWQPFFEDLERRGVLAQLLRWIDEQVAEEDQYFRLLARKTLITDAEKLAEIHAQQGCLAAFAKIRKRMRMLGERQKDPFANLRPVGTDAG